MDLKRYQKLAEQVARDAGNLLLTHLHGKRTIEYKSEIDPVTEVDKASERLLTEFFRKQTPEIDILAEEESNTDTGASLRWVIDPLDGTVNYAHKIPAFCVSVGLELDRRPLVGVVFDPNRDELFSATAESSATCNGQPIHVSATDTLNRAVLATGFPYDKRVNPDNNIDHFGEVALASQGIRRFGAAALDLCWTAMGRFDGYWELRLSPWDVAAGRLIVEQAGGRVTDFAGNPTDSFAGNICATNGLFHDDLLAVLARNRHW